MAHPFQRVEHLTEWYAVGNIGGSHHIVVCRDLHDRQYAYRILCVVEDMPDPPTQIKDCAEGLLQAVVLAHRANGRELAGLDREHGTITDHWHVQACFTK